MQLIRSQNDLKEGLAALLALDPRLKTIADIAGHIPLRQKDADFATLANIVVSQLISVASANAIWGRLQNAIDFGDVPGVAGQSDNVFRDCGLTRGKTKTIRLMAQAIVGGQLDLDAVAQMPFDEARAALVALHGIGPWSADVYLLFSLGHRDLFPVGDVALQQAVADAFGLVERPKGHVLETIAAQWSPYRSIAARLFWAYYGVRGKSVDAFPVG